METEFGQGVGRRDVIKTALAGGAMMLTGCGGNAVSGHPQPPRASKPELGIRNFSEGQELIFPVKGTGSYNIWAKSRTGKITNLTPNDFDNMNPAPSQDGQRITYYRDKFEEKPTHLRIFDRGTRGDSRVSPDDGHFYYDPAFLTGSLIVCKRCPRTGDGSGGDIVIMNADGSDMRIVARGGETELWKPAPIDGWYVVVTRMKRPELPLKSPERDGSNVLEILNLLDGVFETLTPDDGLPHWFPAVNPAGTQVLYISQESEQAPTSLWTLNLRGGRPTRISPVSFTGNFADPSWTPEGNIVCTYELRAGQLAIFGMDADGGNIGIYNTGNTGSCLAPIIISQTKP